MSKARILLIACALIGCEGDYDDDHYFTPPPRPMIDAAVPDALVLPPIPESCADPASCIADWWVRLVGPDCSYTCDQCQAPECRAADCVCTGANFYEIHPEAGNQRHTMVMMHSPSLRRFTVMRSPGRYPWTLNEECRMVEQGALTGMAYTCEETHFDIGVFMQTRPAEAFELALELALDRQTTGSYSY